MNAEMTLVEAMRKIDGLNNQLLLQCIVFGIMVCGLVFIIWYLGKKNSQLLEEYRALELAYKNCNQDRIFLTTELKNAKAQLENSQDHTQLEMTLERLRRAEETIEKLQGVKMGKEYSGPPAISGSAGNESQIVADSIGGFGPGGAGEFDLGIGSFNQ